MIVRLTAASTGAKLNDARTAGAFDTLRRACYALPVAPCVRDVIFNPLESRHTVVAADPLAMRELIANAGWQGVTALEDSWEPHSTPLG